MPIKNVVLVIFVIVFVSVYFAMKIDKSKAPIKIQSPVDIKKIYLGAWVGGFWNNENKELNNKVLKKFEDTIDKKMAFANMFSEWAYLSNPSLIKALNEIDENGWTPLISSNPYFFEKCPNKGSSLYKTIAKGDCDKFLKDVAQNLKSFNKTVFLRFAWEMNLPDMYWSIEKTKSTSEDFKAAWRRFHDILEKENTTNVIWVLSFNTSNANTVPYKDLYPGDDYVDWVAIDGYNWGNSHDWSGWANFSGVFYNSYDELIKVSKKPLMLSEVNSAPSEFGGDKATWLDDMLTVQIPEKYEQIKAVVFFNEEKEDTESIDWRIEKSNDYIQSVKMALKREVYKSYFP